MLAAGDFARIEAIARETYSDLRGDVHTLLTSEEAIALSVKRGSLTDEEFDEIRSHVSPHVPVPLAGSRGARRSAASRSSPGRTTSA